MNPSHIIERLSVSRAGLWSNPFQAVLALLFVSASAFMAIHLSWAQTTTTTSSALTPLTTNQSAVQFQVNPISQAPGAPPLVMLLLSRDEQLSIKAYTDYTDLNGNGHIDTTYNDTFVYAGYFDSTLCYSYSTSNNLFAASGGVTGGTYPNGVIHHQCNGSAWAGNFLNWLTMTRMDIVRYTLFGGKRSVDTTSQTVLQRAYLPDDVHSFQKVYTGSDINQYTPYTSAPMSFCNTSDLDSFYSYYPLSPDGAAVGYHPLLRVAKGSFPEWAATEERQCDWGDSFLTSQSYADTGTQNSDQPLSTSSGSAELQVFVDVCDNPSYRESFCRAYTSGATVTYKPAGLLQQYGESGQLRFGLITGTYDHPRSGGAVRRNIGLIAGNGTPGCATGDEINLQTGQFCIQSRNSEGIINNINRLQVSQWPDAPGGYYQQGTSYYDCNNPTGPITNRTSGVSTGLKGSPSTDVILPYTACSDWHNPLAEMYAEALRYIEGGSNQATSGFVPAANGVDNSMGLSTSITWSDPYSPANYCASCSIVVLSTGFGSFDSDEIPNNGTIPNLGESAAAATTRLGNIENTLVGNIIGNDVIGYYGLTPTQTGNTDVTANSTTGVSSGTATCSAKGVADFSLVRGVCPEQPNFEGSYYLAGLAFDAWTHDLRPDLISYPGTRHVQTFAVSLAETLPTLNFTVGTSNIVISPLCENYGYQATTTSKGAGNAPLPDTTQRMPNITLNGISTCTIDDASTLPQPASATASAPFAGVTFGLKTVTNANGSSTGSLVVVYDDSPWGHDHDRDIVEMITYCSGSACTGSGICQDKVFSNQAGTALIASGGTARNACLGLSGVNSDGSGVGSNQILVRTEMISASSGNGLVAGFNINGTTVDGPYATANHPGSQSDTSSVLTGQGVPLTPNNQLGLGTAPVVVEFTASSSSSNTLQNPLFYAAKYGGFVQSVNNTPSLTPSTQAQWDQVNNSTGQPGADGLPDNYFPVRNPAKLSSQLSIVFGKILAGTGSGTAAAVAAGSRLGDGATYQATYITSQTDQNNKSVTWLGSLQSLLTDQEGNLRENNPSKPGVLSETDFSSATGNPAVVQVYVNSTTGGAGTSKFNRYNCDPNIPTCMPVYGSPFDLSQLNTVWNARDQLAQLTNVTSNRAYTTSANTGRYIFTFIDKNLDGVVANGVVDANGSEAVSFALSSFQNGSNNTFGLLNVGDATSAQTLINYIRGQDYTGLRNRTINLNNASTTLTYPLGDIVDSNPTVVASPQENFDVIYSDQSYNTFRTYYQARRNVVYAGANDGMLHAFNGGFYNAQTTTFQTTPLAGSTATAGATAHPLGSELWAYVPFNLLSHLIWLTQTNYNHIYYVDGAPRTFDARIFKSDADHPGGWGTVLVVGFRFGGGNIDLPASNCMNAAAFSGFSVSGSQAQSCPSPAATIPAKDIYTHSAYVVMDVTNPEKPPVLMAELGTDPTSTNSDFGFTTSYPTPISFSALGGSTTDNWYLTFGNGPTSTSTGTTTSSAQLFLYAMANSTLTARTPLSLPASSATFTGDPVVVDWDLDAKIDSLFVGTVGGTATSPNGQLIKVDTTKSATDPSQWTVSSLLNPAMPISSAPATSTDLKGQHWVYAGTGRLLVSDDKKNNVTQQSLFGVIDNGTPPSYSNLLDTTLAVVSKASANAAFTVSGISGVTNEATLESAVQSALGWKIMLNLPASGSTASAERVLSSPTIFDSVLIALAYTPDSSLCLGLGSGRAIGVNYITGAANPAVPAFGTTTNSSGAIVAVTSESTGSGQPSGGGVVTGATTITTGKYGLDTQGPGGNVNTLNVQGVTNSGSTEVDWRETLPSSN